MSFGLFCLLNINISVKIPVIYDMDLVEITVCACVLVCKAVCKYVWVQYNQYLTVPNVCQAGAKLGIYSNFLLQPHSLYILQ